MYSKLLSNLTIVLALCVTLVGCGKKEENTQENLVGNWLYSASSAPGSTTEVAMIEGNSSFMVIDSSLMGKFVNVRSRAVNGPYQITVWGSSFSMPSLVGTYTLNGNDLHIRRNDGSGQRYRRVSDTEKEAIHVRNP